VTGSDRLRCTRRIQRSERDGGGGAAHYDDGLAILATDMLRPLTLVLACALGSSLLASRAAAQVPFPIDKNARLEDLGDKFTVTGRMRVPRRFSIESMRALVIKGDGPDATLEVSGNLKMRAATGGKIEFQSVWLELTPECKEIHLADCLFKGRGGIRPSPDGPSETKIFFERVDFERGSSLTIEASNGSILMDGCTLDGPLVLRGVSRSETVKSGFTVEVYGSSGKTQDRIRGLLGGVTIEGIKDGTIRTCDLAGPQALFIDNRKLYFDGNNARAKRVEFRNTATGLFADVKITKSDFRPKKLVVSSPRVEGVSERLTFDGCYFRGIEDPGTLRKEMLEDSENSESGATAILRDVRAQPHGLAGLED
jgi:hypothetical protein